MAKQVRVTPQEMAERWKQGLNSNIGRIIKGIDRVTESPTQKAARNQDKWLAGVQQAHTSGKYAAGCNAVTLEEWKAVTKQKLSSSIPTGTQAAMPKMVKSCTALIAHINAGLGALESMPKISLADSKARMMAWFDHMSQMPTTA